MNAFTFHNVRSIISEPGSIIRIAEICQKQSIRRPMIITDPGIVGLGLLKPLEKAMHEGGIPFTTYHEVVADPPERVILAALEQAKAFEVDGIIGFGGGSSLDTAKLVALMARSGESLAAIYGVDRAKGDRLPLILIPTTAGTGSEVTAVAVVTTGETTKMGVVANQLYADVALLDAELTLGLPPSITAMTGVDAMVHATEAFTSAHKKNFYSDMVAREALRLLAGNIQTATHRGRDLQAREAMLLGACLAGQAFANAPVAAVHALAYPLGGRYHLPHGLTNALVLPHVLRFNAPVVASLYAELAAILIPKAELKETVTEQSVQLIDYFVTLIEKLDLPPRLRDVKVPESDLPTLASDAMQQQRLLSNNPRGVTESDALAIYRAAY